MEKITGNSVTAAVERDTASAGSTFEKSGTSSKVFYRVTKRVFDIVVSGIGIIMLSWLLLILYLAVKLTSKGPGIFIDKRVGKGGKDIKVYKFRSMYLDADARIKEYLTPEQYEIWKVERKIDNDPRITKVGNFLRKTSLDELPQLFNIFNGTISCVGPRPITRMELETNYTEAEQKKLCLVRPGLTGNWAARGRSLVTFESGERQRLELEYIDKCSLGFDAEIIWITVNSVIHGVGAR